MTIATIFIGLKPPTKSCDGLLANFFIRMLGKVDIHSKHSIFSGALLEDQTQYISYNNYSQFKGPGS